jgi:hypothetical protein
MSVRFNIKLSVDEARLLREPGDQAVLDGLLGRVLDCAYKVGIEHMTAAWPGVLRGVVEGLAEQGNPRAVASLLFESRLAEQPPREEATPAEAPRWPTEALRVEVVGMPPAEPKVVKFTRGLDGKIVFASSSDGEP